MKLKIERLSLCNINLRKKNMKRLKIKKIEECKLKVIIHRK